MKDQNIMQDSTKRFIDACLVLLVAVTLCVIFKEAMQFAARLLRIGLYAALQGVWTDSATLMVRNFCRPIQGGASYVLHMCLEGCIWGSVALFLWSRSNSNKKAGKHRRLAFRNGYFAAFYTFLLMVISLELVSYMAYLFEFVCDAAWAGITSSAPSLTLRNIVSFKRWAEVDWIARACEAYVFCRIWFWWKRVERKHERKAARHAKSGGEN